MRSHRSRRVLVLLAAGVSLCASLPAASYFPMADADLVRLAPIAVRAEVLGKTTRLDPDGDRELPFTVVTLRSLELYKGMIEETFRVVTPGGMVEDSIWWVPGAPAFEEGQEVVLMLNPLPGRFGEYGLSEFGLSKFDLVSDAVGRRFLVRPVFQAREDLLLSKHEYPLVPASVDAAWVPSRDAESFLAALRGLVGATALAEIGYAMPTGGFTRVHSGLRQKWANLGGVELGDCGGVPCLFRWFFDTGASPDATVFVTGSQTNLVDHYPPCHVDQTCMVSASLNNWHNVANTDIRISGPMSTGNFEIKLDQDVAHNGTSWTTPYDCSNGGVAGIGGPMSQGAAKTFKGLSPYYACNLATVSMRRFTCSYPSDYFVNILTHEMGHALGLNHPDQFQSVFSTTTPAQWQEAIMVSTAHSTAVTTPQTDDIQAMQFYYGTMPPGPAPAANFSFSPAAPKSSSVVAFTDTSTNSPTGWLWFFGDPTSDNNFTRDRNPSHVYAAPGNYTVDLIAGNLDGGSRTSKQVAVAQGGVPSVCTPNTTTLCLNAGRFKVTADWQKTDGSSGHGTAISLTPDTGYFWFFSSTNIEVVTKVIGFCANPFNSYWVFAAGLTNVKVTLTSTDTKNGTIVPKENPLGTPFVAIQDTAAFKTCP